MATAQKFEDMEVWQVTRLLVKDIYRVSNSGQFSKDFGLKDQIRRAAISILSNIAEGFERSGNREFVHFLYIAKGSAGELRAQLYAALDQAYLTDRDFESLSKSSELVARQLSGLIKYLQRSARPILKI
jgi:four helix bundle protein